ARRKPAVDARKLLNQPSTPGVLHSAGTGDGQDLMLARIGLASNLMTCRGDDKVRMTYHSQSSSPTAAADLVVAILDRRRRSKTPRSFGSLLKASAIRRSRLTLHEWIFSSFITTY